MTRSDSSARANDDGRRPPKLAARWRWAVYLIALGIWLTGAVWIVLQYSSDENYAARQWLLRIHVLFGLLGVWFFGALFALHVAPGWRKRERRWTGSAQFLMTAWLAATGYYIYHAPPEFSGWLEWLHWTFGMAAPLLFIVHRFWAVRSTP